jgi:imidazolonepropionase-like amidohydrolase
MTMVRRAKFLRQEFGRTSAMWRLRALATLIWATALLPEAGPALFGESAPSSQIVVIRAGKLFDSESGRLLNTPTVIISGNRIESVSSGQAQTPSTARLIDLGDATLLPGFIDVHTHLTISAGSGGYETLGVSIPRAALIGAKNARVTLLAGFTTVRNVGAEGYADVALRDAINSGDVIGPRMQVSGPPLGITGGHCDNSLLPPEFHHSAEGVADGPEMVMHRVREVIKYGADVVKFCASGGVFSKGDNPLLEQYSPAEMQVLIAEAHRLGRKVATHAHSALSIKDAVRAGVDSIEHGIFLDDEGIALMKEHHTFLVPTSYPLFWFSEHEPELHLAPWVQEKAALIIPAAKKNMANAFRSGVRVALGTDAGVYPHGLNAGEFWSMVELGMAPLQSLQAGTINAAELMGWSDRIGSIRKGMLADIVAVRGNPLSDVRLLQHVQFVMKDGVVYKDEISGSGSSSAVSEKSRAGSSQ